MKKIFVLLVFLTLVFSAKSQDVDSLLNTMVEKSTEIVQNTFKATRVLNGQSVEQMNAKHLDFRIHHRFGKVNSGAYNFYGLDQSTIFLALEYGLTDKIEVGIGRTTENKTVSGFAKYKLLQQKKGEKSFPISLSLLGETDVIGIKWADPSRTNYFSSRVAYTGQVLIARKFNSNLSLQLTPTVVHQNMVNTALESNDQFAVGLSGRYKLTNRASFNFEYFYLIKPPVTENYNNTNSLSFGFDIETGGHVFQILLTNSLGMNDRSFITNNTGKWSKGDIMLGFNISRVFSFDHPKK